MGALNGLAVLVTRPAAQNASLMARLRDNGADAVALPLLAINPLTDAACQARIAEQLDHLSEQDFAVFISQNAAEQALSVMQLRAQAWPAAVQVFAVGSTTAAYLAQHGIVATVPLRMDSEGLLALPVLQQVNGLRGIVFRGLGGRENLATVLRERGATVEYCELYQRALPEAASSQWQAWRQRRWQGKTLICINSVESLKHLLSVAANDDSPITGDNVALLVPSVRVAHAAAQQGFMQIITAPDARDDSMINTILHWYTS